MRIRKEEDKEGWMDGRNRLIPVTSSEEGKEYEDTSDDGYKYHDQMRRRKGLFTISCVVYSVVIMRQEMLNKRK